MRAISWASGLIEFVDDEIKVPRGAIIIAYGPETALRDLIEPTARHGYRTEISEGKPIKVAGSDQLLVPGVPEAGNQVKGSGALRAYCEWIRKSAPKEVTVL